MSTGNRNHNVDEQQQERANLEQSPTSNPPPNAQPSSSSTVRAGTTSAPISHERAVPLAFRHSPLSSSSSPPGGRRLSSSSASLAASNHYQLLQGGSLTPPLSSSSPLVHANTNGPVLSHLSLTPTGYRSKSHKSSHHSSFPRAPHATGSPLMLRPRRPRTASLERAMSLGSVPVPSWSTSLSPRYSQKKVCSHVQANEQSRAALQVNDSMVYLDGPRVYTCQQCRTHLTSHDDIISKSFHGRHGRAYLLDQAVNIRVGPSEDRMLMTGLHSVCDIFCQRCNTLIGWTYQKAYEASQKYKEGKYIIEKINLYLEESDYYDVPPPAGERTDRWRQRSLSWGSHNDGAAGPCPNIATDVYEYPATGFRGGTRP